MSNPYVFIVGCPRSGTTLLQRLVDAHPQIAIILESHWIPRLYGRDGVRAQLDAATMPPRKNKRG